MRRVIICSDHLVGLLGLITCEVEGCGQVARLLVTVVRVRLPRDFGVVKNAIRIQVLQTTHVDHEERAETEQTRTGETSKRKARCGDL